MSNAVSIEQAPRQVAQISSIKSGARALGIVPQTFEECYRLAKMMAASGMVPDSFREKPEACCVAIMQGLELGLSPVAALQSIAIINGRPCLYGDGALAVVRSSGLVEAFSETDNGSEAVCTIKRKGEPDAIVRKFSIDDAKRANLANKKGPWQDYPQRMRQMRARSWALRDGFADVLKGMPIGEEVQDIPAPPMRDITPASAPAEPAAQTGYITDEEVEQLQSRIVSVGANIKRLYAHMSKAWETTINELKDIPASRLQSAHDMLDAKEAASNKKAPTT